MFLVSWLFILLQLSLSNGLKNNFKVPTYSTALSRAMEDVFVNFYAVEQAVVHIFRESYNETNYIQDSYLINEVLYRLGSEIIVNLENEEELEPVEKKRIYNVIVVDCYESFYKIFKKFEPDYFDFQGFYLVVLTLPFQDHYSLVTRIFLDFWMDYIVNVNVIVKPDLQQDEAFMYTYFPYSKHSCGEVRPFIIARYGETKSLFRSSYFPEKVKNLFKCPLRVAIFETKPFMIIEKNSRGRIEIDGVDAILLKYVAEKMNFRPIFKISDEQRGKIFENGTTTGAFRMVTDLQANFTIGYITKKVDRDKIMTPSYYYFTAQFVWIVPPGRQYTSFEKLFKPFAYELWTCVTVMFLFSCGLIAVWRWRFVNAWNFSFGKHIKTPYLDLFNIFLGGTIYLEPLKNFSRFLLMTYLLYALVIRNAYQGALFQFLQKDANYPQVQTIGDMVKENYNFYMTTATTDLFTNIPEVRDRIILFGQKDTDNYNRKTLHHSFEGVVLSTQTTVDYLNILNLGKYYFRTAKEVIFYMQLCIYMHKPTPLREEINNIIQSATTFGLIEEWVSLYTERPYLKHRDEKSELKALSNSHLMGGYQIFCGGLMIAYFVFLFEILSTKIKVLRNLFLYLSK